MISGLKETSIYKERRSEMDVIGIDIGYGYTKSFTVASETQRKLIFQTLVSPYTPEICFGINFGTITVNGKKYAIGEELMLNQIPCETTTREDFVGSPSYMAILGYVLSHTNFHGKVLVTGLPPTFYYKKRAEELSELIKEQWITDDMGKPILLPEIIKVIPQGAGIFFSFVINHPSIFEENVLVVDIGYYTLDIVFFTKGKYVEGAAMSFSMGVKRIYDEIRKKFGRIHGVFSKDDESIEEIIRYGKYTHSGKEYQLNVTDIINSYRNMISSTIKSRLGDMVKLIDYILVGGGGVNLFRETMSGVILVEDPQFANARGFYLYGKKLLQD